MKKDKNESKKLNQKIKNDEFDLQDFEDRVNIALQDEGLDINKRLARGMEEARLRAIEESKQIEEFEKQQLAREEQKRKEAYEKELKQLRLAEYNKEIQEKGYANKGDYPDLFPEEEELNPRKILEEQKKKFGYQ